MVDKNAAQPLYFQVKEDIKKQIEEQKLKPGDVLPTENWLCQHYGVSRVTIRKTLSELISEGVLVRDHGKAARVASIRFDRYVNRLTGLTEELKMAGIESETSIIKFEKVHADNRIAVKMGLPEGEPLFYINRLRYAAHIPMCEQAIYLRVKCCPTITAQELSDHSLYSLLETKYHQKIDYADQTVYASSPTYRQAALLEMADVSDLLCVERKTMLTDNTCVELTTSYYVASRYKYTMRLYR